MVLINIKSKLFEQIHNKKIEKSQRAVSIFVLNF